MKPLSLIALAIPLMALSSCSSVKQTFAKVQGGTVKTFRAAKEKTFGSDESKIKLTKADSSRFLPAGTSVETALNRTSPSQPSRKQTRLLAKHTESSSPPRPSKLSAPMPKLEEDAAAIPTLELPPLPQASEEDSQEFKGFLPALDGNNNDTFIDIDGNPLELPPMNLPEIDEEPEPDTGS